MKQWNGMMNQAKEASIAASRRKNRASRKLTRLENIDPIFKILTLAIIDKLNCYSKYRIAWPSVPTLARIIGRSERTTLRYLKKVYAAGFFRVHRLTPQQAVEFLKDQFDIDVNLKHCRLYSPNLYEINVQHALWHNSEKFPAEVVEQIRTIAGVNQSTD